jgi:ANTAR domain/GAF domain
MDRERRLGETFVELADTLVDDFDVIDFLQVLAVRCVELLDVAAAGIVLADQDGSLRTMAASDERARLLELFEVQNDEGPCRDCYQLGAAVVNIDLDGARERWPQFAPHAIARGFRSANALPLRLRSQVIGSLNLFHADAGGLDSAELRTAQALADAATIGILQQRTIRRGEVVAGQLQAALTSRIIIEQAKGVLAERLRISTDDAFEVLRAAARSRNRLLSDLAREVADGSADPAQLVSPPAAGLSAPG